ncbi:MAG: gluconokinase [Anaerolineaceae bacterium]|nr:gluconokinase [Anaerolineaceae bacterium]
MTTYSENQTEPPFVLALDIGTSSIRAMLFDRQGQAVPGADSRQKLSIDAGLDGAFETDADTLLGIAWQAIDQALANAGKLSRDIKGVCCCTFVSNVMGINAAGKAVTPLVLYADTRAAAQAAALRQMLDEEEFHQRTGTRFHSSYLPARLLWWKQEKPEQFSQVKRWISIHEYMLLLLFGESAVSYSVASWTGLQHRARLEWDEKLIAHLPVDQTLLPTLVDASHSWSGLRAVFAERWPALKNVPWFPAIGDGAAANLGSGCASPDRVAISMGTSSAVRTVTTDTTLVLPPGLWCYRVDARRCLLGGAMTEGGSIFSWLRRLLNLESTEDIDPAIALMQPGEHGLTFLPLISGERSPGWVSEARGALMGLSLATSPLDLLRAGMEGVACRIALVYNLLRPALPADPLIIATGGAIQSSPAWQQILADALNRPLRLSRVAETSTRGAALLALEALEIIEDAAKAPDLSDPAAFPDPGHHARYQEMMAQQKIMYESLITR